MKSGIQKIQIIHLMAAVAFLIISLLVFTFLYTDMKKNRKTAQESEIAWLTEAERRSLLQSVNRSLNTLQAERVLFDSHFIKGGDVVPFLSMVEELAPKAGAKVEVSLVDLLKDNSGLVVEMRTGGKFESVYKFLMLLENSSYEMDFMSIDMQRMEIEDEAGKITSQWLGVFRVKVLSFVP